MKKMLLLSIYLCSFMGFSQTIGLQQVATGFSTPVEITQPANDTRLFVVQKAGLIRIVNSNGTVNGTPFLNMSTLINTDSEMGLLGLAFHPNYASNGIFFIHYNNTAGSSIIARYTVSANPNVANTTGTILMTISQPDGNHKGGTLRFGADGYLYIGMGDGGGAGDTSGYAQNLSLTHPQVAIYPTRIYLGKMLRIDVDSTTGSLNYGIPPTNPFAAEAGKEEIWAYGLRNPWKFSFNRTNGDLWIADVGQSIAEEVNKIPSPLPTGLNFGWRCYEGNTTYSTSIGPCPAYNTTVAPVTQYGHGSSRCSITGGFIYRGVTYPNMVDKYFLGDYCTGEIGYIGTSGTITWAYNTNDNYSITTFGQDSNGELYVAVTGTIYKIIDTSLATSDFERNGFSLYPNPAKTEIFIKNSKEVALSQVRVFDLTGKMILSKSLENNETPSLNISGLSNGMYLVAVEDLTGNKYQSKLVVQ